MKHQEHSNFNSISDRYFETMGSSLLGGRDFDARDSAIGPKVAIVTESFARVYLGGANPLGRMFQIDERPGDPRPAYTIVGLARDSKYNDLRNPFEPLMFVPAVQDPQQPQVNLRLVVRSPKPASAVTSAIAAIVRGEDPEIVVNFRTMETQVHDSLFRERLMALLSTIFGALAALIATIGLYGVMSYTVARRRNEIGIRMALGADSRQVIHMVMREAGALLGAGIVIGTLAALAVGRLASALLFGLAPSDPLTLASAAIAFSAVAGFASYVPARRAAHLEPTEALHED